MVEEFNMVKLILFFCLHYYIPEKTDYLAIIFQSQNLKNLQFQLTQNASSAEEQWAV